ncbi:hypothetical protein MYAER_3006 [Microcystis aeruginosa NIES-2549]|uniref:Uncharacterized protein n=1 Tax=Microcystis aeruginosa NIES-2549 TaxID=1641812 RepID=A0A0F6U5V7_MICAE|nr:hypothetical protein MYAER_3006 [Microcystis aeruginosa NIES-2549]
MTHNWTSTARRRDFQLIPESCSITAFFIRFRWFCLSESRKKGVFELLPSATGFCGREK